MRATPALNGLSKFKRINYLVFQLKSPKTYEYVIWICDDFMENGS